MHDRKEREHDAARQTKGGAVRLAVRTSYGGWSRGKTSKPRLLLVHLTGLEPAKPYS